MWCRWTCIRLSNHIPPELQNCIIVLTVHGNKVLFEENFQCQTLLSWHVFILPMVSSLWFINNICQPPVTLQHMVNELYSICFIEFISSNFNMYILTLESLLLSPSHFPSHLNSAHLEILISYLLNEYIQ